LKKTSPWPTTGARGVNPWSNDHASRRGGFRTMVCIGGLCFP